MFEYKIAEENGEVMVAMNGELTIRHAGELKGALVEAVGRSKAVCLDLARVSGADLAGLQVICATVRTLANTGGRLRLAAQVAPQFRAAVKDAGFQLECITTEPNTVDWG